MKLNELLIMICFCYMLTFLTGQRSNDVIENAQSETPAPIVRRILNKILTTGHWTSWSSWICDAICGKGKYFRKRVCIATGDKFGIPTCHGQSIERASNTCRVPCRGIKELRELFFGPTLSKSLKNALHETLTSGNYAYERKVGETVRFDCYNVVTVELLVNYSTSSIYWEKNDNRIRFDFSKMMLSDYSILEINDLTPSDTGVYTCNVRLSKSFKKTILVFSLIVLGDPYQLHVSASNDVRVTCNSNAIGNLFFRSASHGLQVQWIVNSASHVIKAYLPSIPPQKVNTDIIINVKEEDTGLWACVIRDHLYNRTWVTNAFHVKVNRNLVMTTWRSQKPITKIAIVLVVILISATLCGAIGFYVIQKYKRHQEGILSERLRLILEVSEQIKSEEERKQFQRDDEVDRAHEDK